MQFGEIIQIYPCEAPSKNRCVRMNFFDIRYWDETDGFG